MTIFKDKKSDMIFLNYKINEKRKRKSTGLKWNDENVKYVKNVIIPKIQSALNTDVKDISFKYYSNIFLKNQEIRAKFSFFQRLPLYEKVIKFFENKNVDEITASDIQVYVNDLKIKAKSKQPYIFAIKEILNLAIMDNIIKYNAAVNVKLGSDKKEKIEYFEGNEIAKILEVAFNDKNEEIYNHILIVSSTGIRIEECIALKWVDFKNGYIDIERAKTYENGIKETKTTNGKRKVPFPHFDKLKKNKSLSLFPNIKGSRHFRHQWNRVIINAGVEYKKLKNLRHTYATLSLLNNVPINILSAVLGHSSPKVTLDKYAAIIKNEQAIFDDRLFSINFDVSNDVSMSV